MPFFNFLPPVAARPLVKIGVLMSLLGTLGGSFVNNPAVAQPQGTLKVQVSGLRDLVGQVCLKIFAAGQPFPDGAGVPGQGQCVPIAANPLTVQFDNLPYGQYAVAAFHDRNQDGQINQGAFGIPLEGFGFSNNPPIGFGPPSFEAAKIFHTAPQTRTSLRIRYMQ